MYDFVSLLKTGPLRSVATHLPLQVLCGALGRLLLQSPALAAAPLVRQAVLEAQRFAEHPDVENLATLLQKAQPCLDGAMKQLGLRWRCPG